jgi:hypothetical protein
MKLEMFLKILAISVAHRKIDQFNISDHLKAPPPPFRQELIFSNPTNNSHGPLGVQFRKKRMKLKMFLKILAISVVHRKIYQFNIRDHLKALPLLGRSSSSVTQLTTATALWVFSLEKLYETENVPRVIGNR